MTLRYRPEIDGLRALAVLLVILYHADLGTLNGGYIGVDVFFVISGFLITSLILSDLRVGTFSLLSFWERRIKRILPALVVVTIATLIGGWIIYLPQDFASLGDQVASQSIFSSNILFYTISGYFTAENTTKPLLHTWSLAVEEQFYLLFPFLMLFLYKKIKESVLYVLVALFILSFGASVWAVVNFPDAAFYLLPFRMWELLCGSLLAYRHTQTLPSQSQNNLRDNILSWAGLFAIVLPGFMYDPKTPFPGVAALAPCLGAALIIHTNTNRLTQVGKILSMRPLVFIGLISYSLYLWHWPLLMLAEYVPLIELRSLHRICILILSAGLAYLTWKFVERPMRKKQIFQNSKHEKRWVYSIAFCSLIALAISGLYISYMKGLTSRWAPSALQYAADKNDINPYTKQCTNKSSEQVKHEGLCQTNPDRKQIDFIVWGDSFADSAAPLFFELSQKFGKNGYIASYHSCPPILNIRQRGKALSDTCYNFNAAVFEKIRREKIQTVILISNWVSWFRVRSVYFDEMEWYDPYKESFPQVTVAGAQFTLDKLGEIGVTPYVMIGQPQLAFNAPLLLAFKNQFNVSYPPSYTPLQKYLRDREQNLSTLIKYNEGRNVEFIDPLPIICPDEKCISEHDGHALYHDKNHLTYRGALFIEPIFDPVFKKM